MVKRIISIILGILFFIITFFLILYAIIGNNLLLVFLCMIFVIPSLWIGFELIDYDNKLADYT